MHFASLFVLLAPTAIELLVFDQTGVDADIIAAAGNQVQHLFRDAGVTVGWTLCQTPGALPCDVAITPAHLVLRLVAEKDRGRLPVRADHHGFALRGPDGRAIHAGVFFDAIRRQAGYAGVAPASLLGAVVAHEIGHLLLGPGHAAAGIMKHPWLPKDLVLLQQGGVGFSGTESRRLREAIGRRR